MIVLRKALGLEMREEAMVLTSFVPGGIRSRLVNALGGPIDTTATLVADASEQRERMGRGKNIQTTV